MSLANRRTVQDLPCTSLVLPTYNPGALLRRTWAEVRHFLDRAPGEWEILFVCDGCTDGSAEHLSAWAGPEGGRVRVLSYPVTRGKGHAVRVGLGACRGRWRLFTDVDLAYRFDDILRLARVLQAGAPVAIASRHHPESRLSLPPSLLGHVFRRHLQSLVFSRLVRWMLPLPYRDTQAGLKGMSAAAADVLLPRLRCPGFSFDCDLLMACSHLGIPVTEVAVHVRYEKRASTTGWRSMVNMLREVREIRNRWRAGARSRGRPAVAAVLPGEVRELLPSRAGGRGAQAA